MATRRTRPAADEELNPTTDVIPAASETRDSRVPNKHPRVGGKLAEPVYLIHDGNYEVTVPAITRERVITDADDEKFGDVVEETLVDEYESKGKHPKGTRLGTRKVGVAHEITDAAEAKALRARGFRDATEGEITASAKAQGGKSIEQIAAEQREKAQANFKRMTGGFRGRDRE